jgi:hypothetical protein
MTHYDMLLAVQLMSEERYGRPRRDQERRQHSEERQASQRLLRSVTG